MTPEYLAGFFDGEGCVNITVSGKHRRAVVRVAIINTNVPMLEGIQRQYGGRVHKGRVRAKTPHWKPFCHVVWTGRQAEELLLTIRPYLILKAAQADLALELFQFKNLPIRARCDSVIINKRFHFVLSANTIAKEAEFKNKMHYLNRRGNDASQTSNG